MNKRNAHPTYSNPQIAEVVCEFHFSFNKGKEPDDSLAGEIFTKFQENFPKMRTVQEIEINLEADGEGFRRTPLPPQIPLPPRQRLLFTNPEQHNYQLQHVANIFVVNFVADKSAKYPGWGTFKDDVLNYWSDARSVIKPNKTTRIGLRYINTISFRSAAEKPSAWIGTSKYIPEYILDSERGFFSRNEAKSDKKNRLIVTLGEQVSDESTYGKLVLDIDRVTEQNVAQKNIESTLEAMHDDIWDVFDSGKTRQLENLLKEKT